MIGNCDCCNRKHLPVARANVAGEPMACFICRGDDDPDPYGEMPKMGDTCPYCGGPSVEVAFEFITCGAAWNRDCPGHLIQQRL